MSSEIEQNENIDSTNLIPAEELTSSIRTRKRISQQERITIINHHLNGLRKSSISDIMKIPRSTIFGIISIFEKEGRISENIRGGDRRTKISNENKELLQKKVDEDPTISLKQLKEYAESRFNLNVGCSTIDRCLRSFHYTLKSVVNVPERRNCPVTIEKRFVYAEKFHRMHLDLDDKRFIFIDEVGFCVSSRAKKGRSLIGTSVYVATPSIRSRNISIIASMNKYGMVNHLINNRPVTGVDFKAYLLDLKETCQRNGVLEPIFIVDNAKIHHFKGVLECVNNGEILINYLPPYSPFLNPIENCFSKWKNYVIRCGAKNEGELDDYIRNGFCEITENDCNGYFRKMLKYIEKSRLREVIFE